MEQNEKSREFQNVNEPSGARVRNNTTITIDGGFNSLRFCRHGPMLYNQNDAYVGRSLDLYGEYNEDEWLLLNELVRPHTFVVEVGANLGSHTVALAKASSCVFAFEPQRLIYQTLCANIAFNQLTNVFAWQAAIGGGHLPRTFMPELDPHKPYNFGAVSMQTEPSSEAVVQLTLDSLNIPQCGLLKIDVEGMELDVLRGAAQMIGRFRPYLYVENDRAEKSAALIEHLQLLGYTLYWHLPPLFNPSNFAQYKENVFPGIVSVNMLCLPRPDMDSFGLRRVRGPDDRWN
jgi:FkbM family methyltransferase